MILTVTGVTAVINHGKLEQSPEAVKYITAVREKTGLDIVCCYVSASQFLKLPEKPFKKTNESNTRLLNQLKLEIYIRASLKETKIKKGKYEKILSDIFFDSLGCHADTFEYQRCLTPDEMQLYGFVGKKHSEWDKSRILYPKDQPEYICEVDIQSFNHLAMYHLLFNCQKKVNDLPSVVGLGARVYCGFDEEREDMTYYIILPDGKIKDLSAIERDTVINEVYSLLQRVDKNGVISSMQPEPIFTAWSKLSPDMRVALLKG